MRGALLGIKDLFQCPGPHKQTQAMFKYLWYGAGSVPWRGEGKHPLAQLLFLLSRVISTHQLDILNILVLSIISVSTLVSTYSRDTSEGSTTSRYCEGLSLVGAHMIEWNEKLRRDLGRFLLIPNVAHVGTTTDASTEGAKAQNERRTSCGNWYVSMKELIKGGYFTLCTTARVTYATGIT